MSLPVIFRFVLFIFTFLLHLSRAQHSVPFKPDAGFVWHISEPLVIEWREEGTSDPSVEIAWAEFYISKEKAGSNSKDPFLTSVNNVFGFKIGRLEQPQKSGRFEWRMHDRVVKDAGGFGGDKDYSVTMRISTRNLPEEDTPNKSEAVGGVLYVSPGKQFTITDETKPEPEPEPEPSPSRTPQESKPVSTPNAPTQQPPHTTSSNTPRQSATEREGDDLDGRPPTRTRDDDAGNRNSRSDTNTTPTTFRTSTSPAATKKGAERNIAPGADVTSTSTVTTVPKPSDQRSLVIKIGVGVGVGVVVILSILIIVLFIIFRRRRRDKMEVSSSASTISKETPSIPPFDPTGVDIAYAQPVELSTSPQTKYHEVRSSRTPELSQERDHHELQGCWNFVVSEIDTAPLRNYPPGKAKPF